MKKNNNRKTWKKSGRVRKKNRGWRVIDIYFTPEELNKLEEVCKQTGKNPDQFIKEALEQFVKNKKGDVNE